LQLQQYDWFSDKGFFLKTHPPLIILRQEELSDDLQHLSRLLDLKRGFTITDDETLSHKNNYDGVPHLSAKPKQNLRIWYAQDFEFYDRCCFWIGNNRCSI